jgi:hypothetical protein
MQTAMDRAFKSRWWAPLYSLGLGAIVFTAFAIGGNAADGAKAFALFVVIAAVFYFGSPRSDTAAWAAPAATSAGPPSTYAPPRSADSW